MAPTSRAATEPIAEKPTRSMAPPVIREQPTAHGDRRRTERRHRRGRGVVFFRLAEHGVERRARRGVNAIERRVRVEAGDERRHACLRPAATRPGPAARPSAPSAAAATSETIVTMSSIDSIRFFSAA